MAEEVQSPRGPLARSLVIAAGVSLALITHRLSASWGLSDEGRAVAAVGVLMAAWWMGEAISLEATSLLPIVLFPALGAATLEQVCAPFANKVIFFFLGGMMLGRALEVWNVHKRLAIGVVSFVGAQPRRLVGGFLLATAFVSMWVSNAAATVMVLPIALSVVELVCRNAGPDDAKGRLRSAVLLSVCFGASIGGVGTLIGTAPMAFMRQYLETEAHVEVSFAEWLKVGLPLMGLMLPAAWLVLTRVAPRVPAAGFGRAREVIRGERAALGRWSAGQVMSLCVFGLAVVAWLTASYTGLEDSTIAIGAALLLFALPAGKARRPLLTWDEARHVPWGVLVLMGGGIALADAITRHGVDKAIAELGSGLAGAHTLVVLMVIAAASVALTEFCSNTPLVAAGLPIIGALALSANMPVVPLVATMSLAASLGFMMPAGTPPNAIVFGSGQVTMRQMMKAGLGVDVCAAVIVPVLVWAAWRLGVLPG